MFQHFTLFKMMNLKRTNMVPSVIIAQWLKFLDPINRRILWTAKTIDLTCVCIQIKNTVVFSDHTHTKLVKNSKQKHVNIKPKVLSNTMLSFSRFRTTDTHRKTERLGQ